MHGAIGVSCFETIEDSGTMRDLIDDSWYPKNEHYGGAKKGLRVTVG